jgi:two-component system, sensor histidine kinase
MMSTKILLVDDRADGRLAMEAVLDGLPYKVFTADSGAQAVRLASEHVFAVILLDVQMPEMDGFKAARLIKRLPLARESSIIFVTAINKESEHVYEGYDCGAVDYIFKPFDPQIMRSKVAVLVDLFEKTQKVREQAQLLVEAEQRERTRQLAELELESLRRYENLADAIPQIVWKAKLDGCVDYVNKVWTDKTGLTLEQSAGHGWKPAIHPEDLAAFQEKWDEGSRLRQDFESEARIKQKSDGSYRWHLIRGVIEKNLKGVSGWILSCTDIQSLKEIEGALALRASELKRSNNELERFAFSASHDLQEPLRKIVTFSDLLSRTAHLEQGGESYLARIQDAAKRMSAMIDNLLHYSRVINKDDKFEQVNLEEVVEGVLLSLELPIKNADCEVLVRDLPTIEANRVSMHQLIQNLLSNAIKFRSQTKRPRIEISSREGDNEWIFSFRDNGIGIDPKYADKIFGIFQRLHSWHEYPGTGIGLAIVKKIIEGHGGRVWVESEVGKGSNFMFSIPNRVSSVEETGEDLPQMESIPGSNGTFVTLKK